MMITMKLGGNRPPGDNPLPFSEHSHVQPREDSNRQHISSQFNALPSEPSQHEKSCQKRVTYKDFLNTFSNFSSLFLSFFYCHNQLLVTNKTHKLEFNQVSEFDQVSEFNQVSKIRMFQLVKGPK